MSHLNVFFSDAREPEDHLLATKNYHTYETKHLLFQIRGTKNPIEKCSLKNCVVLKNRAAVLAGCNSLLSGGCTFMLSTYILYKYIYMFNITVFGVFSFHLKCFDKVNESNFSIQHAQGILRTDLFVCEGCRNIGRMVYKKYNPLQLIPHIDYCIAIDSFRSFLKKEKQRNSRRLRKGTKQIEIEMYETLSCIIGPENTLFAMKENYLFYFHKNVSVNNQLKKYKLLNSTKPSPPEFNEISLSMDDLSPIRSFEFSCHSDDLSNSIELSYKKIQKNINFHKKI